MQHEQGGEPRQPRELGDWMARRGPSSTAAKITADMLETALRQRPDIRSYLACDPDERRGNRRMTALLNDALESFPLVVRLEHDRGWSLRAGRGALAGLSTVVAELTTVPSMEPLIG